MKFFYTKKEFQRVLVELEATETKLVKGEIDKTNLKRELEKKNKEIEEFEKAIKSFNCAKGGYVKEKNKLNTKIQELEESIKVLNKEINNHITANAINETLINGLSNEKEKLVEELEKVKKELETTKNEFKKLQEEKKKYWVLKKISSGRTPNTQKTKIKNSSKESNAIKYVKERL